VNAALSSFSSTSRRRDQWPAGCAAPAAAAAFAILRREEQPKRCRDCYRAAAEKLRNDRGAAGRTERLSVTRAHVRRSWLSGIASVRIGNSRCQLNAHRKP